MPRHQGGDEKKQETKMSAFEAVIVARPVKGKKAIKKEDPKIEGLGATGRYYDKV